MTKASPLAVAFGGLAAGHSQTRYYLSPGHFLAANARPGGDLTHGYAEQVHAASSADDPDFSGWFRSSWVVATAEVRVAVGG